MAHMTLAALHTTWNCRWSQLGHRLSGVAEEHQPEAPLVCARPVLAGNRRPISDEECGTCSHWEAAQYELARRVPHTSFPTRHLSALGHHWVAVAEHALLRSLVVTTGIALAVVGLGLVLSVVLLPVGLALGLIGVGVVVWGSVGDLFGEQGSTVAGDRRS